jgi:hypothetical protein
MAASEGSPLASENERFILDIVRRHEPIARAMITAHTYLTQQSVHRLVETEPPQLSEPAEVQIRFRSDTISRMMPF